MCRISKNRNNGVKVVKNHDNKYIGVRVELTRMTTKSGAITYAVVVRNMNTGRRYRTWTYDGIQKAWNRYKAAVA